MCPNLNIHLTQAHAFMHTTEWCLCRLSGDLSRTNQLHRNYRSAAVGVAVGDVVLLEIINVSVLTFLTLCLSKPQSWNDSADHFSMLNITTMSQAWNCLLRTINKQALICAGNAANGSLWIEPQIVKIPEVALWFIEVMSCADLAVKKEKKKERGREKKGQRKVVYINVCLWLKIHGGFHWTGNDVVSQRCMRAYLSATLQKQSSALSVPGCPDWMCAAAHWNYLLFKNGCENNTVHLHFSAGIFYFFFFLNSSTFPSQQRAIYQAVCVPKSLAD